ncbi:hypothetical protein F4781DRAFT_291996 [Annulohypoxylon bovei var. microspora]|nr:hypothetical protein F4781DRAFT_291996 [Annulohypoxylon bovei var. microspora]
MCRRILTHHMHHDVRTPMILDPSASNPALYANPRATPFHQCELRPPAPSQWLLGSGFPSCAYHSCCSVGVDVEFCAEYCAQLCQTFGIADPEAMACEPEECALFVAEHRHERLEYFGRPDAYPRGWLPATWREDLRDVDCGWHAWFRRDVAHLGRWEELFFYECEHLHTLEQDAKTQFLVYRDLARFWPRGHRELVTAEANVEQAQKVLLEQKENVTRLMNWAQGLPCECLGGFVPVWWMRMWAFNDEDYKE